MKLINFVMLTALFPVMAMAQVTGMSQEQMQNMMQDMQKMQACLAQLDHTALQKLATQGQAMESELKSLCLSGKRGEAERLAMQFARDVQSHSEMKKLQACGEQASSMMPQLSTMIDELEESNTHVCDAY